MKKFKIKKGNHSSGIHIRPHFGIQSMEREVIFTESCVYDALNRDYKDDLNKLFGFSLGWHMKDSIRFGWKPKFDSKNYPTGDMEIWSFVHNNYEMFYKHICDVQVGRKYSLEVYKNEMIPGSTFYDFHVYGISGMIRAHLGYEFHKIQKPKREWGYQLFPYFGGNEVALHDTEILMTNPIIY